MTNPNNPSCAANNCPEGSMRDPRTFDMYVKALLDSAFSYVVLLDRETRVLCYSDSLRRLADATNLDEMLGMPLLDVYKALSFTDKKFLADASRRLARALAGETDFYEDDTVVWPTGENRIYRIQYKRVTAEQHGFDGIFIFSRDITDLRLEEAQQRVNDLMNSPLLPCMVWDEQGNAVAYNREAARVFGVSDTLSPDAFHAQLLSFIPGVQSDGRTTETVRQHLVCESLEKGFSQATVQLAKRDGTPLYFTVNAARITWMFGHRLIIYFYDMTDIMWKEAQAREVEERMKLMLDTSPLGCSFWDDTHAAVDCNAELLRIFNLPDKQTLIDNFFTLSPERQPDGQLSVVKARRNLQKAFDTGYQMFEWVHQTLDGELIPTDVTLVRLKRKDNSAATGYAVVGYIRDLREVKAHEQKMREAAERERQADIQREAAQKADEAKGRFLANMSHEIRTPMNAILGISELLLQEKLNRRQRQHVGDIKTSTLALLGIINDILDVSKLQAGKLSLVPVHYDFNALIDNVSSIAQSLVAEKKITFRLMMRVPAPACLYGDDVRLRQVLLNLLSNAIKFTEKGYVRLAVAFTDHTIRMTVSDSGVGIPAESLPTLFEPFEQADVEKNRVKTGTGLGLAIVKSIVEMMGGTVTVESVYGQGTSFHVEIPKVLGDEALIHRADADELSLHAPGARILVVDDNVVNLNVAAGLIRLCAIAVDTVTTGREAIGLIQRTAYDLVFMDHRMPGMDGIETTRHIRELGIGVPIVALTASVVLGAKESMLDAGMNDYLSKPIITADLRQMLKKWLPADKLLCPPKTAVSREDDEERYTEFWKKLEQIKGLSAATGLARVDGQRDVYEKTVRLLTKEIEKCDRNLRGFLAANDLRGFRVEVHGMKSSLANVGAMTLAAKARELEVTSDKQDIDFCLTHLPEFLRELNQLTLQLKDALAAVRQRENQIELPPELPPVLDDLTHAFGEMDLVRIDQEVEKLGLLNLRGALAEEIEQVKDAIMMMDYDGATAHIRKLLDGA